MEQDNPVEFTLRDAVFSTLFNLSLNDQFGLPITMGAGNPLPDIPNYQPKKLKPLNFPQGSNGRLDRSNLTPIGGGHLLRADAAVAFIELRKAAKLEGFNISVTDSYRDYDAQVDVKRRKGKYAATPGHSNHGWGLALDLNVGGFSSPIYKWLFKNGEKYGWVNPLWARDGKGIEEPWHWEYIGV